MRAEDLRRVDLRAVDLRAVDLRRAGAFLAVDLRRVDLRAVDLRAGDFLAVDFFLRAVDLRAVDFLAVDLRAVDFRAVDLRRAGAFLAVDFLRVDAAFRVPVDRLAAVFLPDVFLAVDFLRAVAMLHPELFLAVDFFLVDFFAAGMLTSFPSSGRHPLQASPFPLAHPAPHAVALVAPQGVVQALDPNGTVRADALGFAGGAAFLGEEDLRVVLPASRSLLPRDEVVHRPLPSE